VTRISKLCLLGGCALGLTLAAVGLFLYAQRSAAEKADPSDRALVALGTSVYAQRCASCHGAQLEGQPKWREHLPNGRLPAPPHNADGHTWHHADRQLFEMTKSGLSNIVPGYESDMPAFKDILTDQQIWAVLAYIKSTWPPHIRARQEQVNQRAEARQEQSQ
jgi:mono/diheme cytochrome c family protein